MKLSAAQLCQFDEEGFLFFPDCCSAEEIAHHDFAPIVPVGDDAPVEYARARQVAAE